MELRHLRYFIAVAEEGSFLTAAERLLERRARGVVLTAAGKVFLDHARLALSQVEAAAEGARRAEQPHTTSCPARKPITNTGFSGRLWVRMRTTQVSKTSPLYPLMADIRADIDF